MPASRLEIAKPTATRSGANSVCDLVIVGDPDPVHVGRHFADAASSLNLQSELLNVQLANAGSVWKRRVYWRILGHRPPRLEAFSSIVLNYCREHKPKYLVTVGLAPVSAPTLRAIGELGTCRFNFLTDDPWNPTHRSNWFLHSLSFYDHVFSPRRSILPDLAAHGCDASYLPFAYSPRIHFAALPPADSAAGPDLAFAGGADPDRVSTLEPLLNKGLDIQLYGGYWDRYRATRPYARGMASPDTVRAIAAAARVSLCLVRRANRDQSCMRTFELPAMGACILAEDTEEHREIYGADGLVALYFRDSRELVEKVQWLVAHPATRQQMRLNTQVWISQSHHTYEDRLAEILKRARAIQSL